MGYSMIFETKIVNLSDGRLIHFDRSGCNNDSEGRRQNDWTAKLYTQEEFGERIERFKNGSKPYSESQPHEWELKIYGRMATPYDYGAHLERMQRRAWDYKDFVKEFDMKIKRHDEVDLISPEEKTMTFDEFVEYTKKLPVEKQLRYYIVSTKLDLVNEQEIVKEIERGAPLEIYIGDRIPVQSMDENEPEEQEDIRMTMRM